MARREKLLKKFLLRLCCVVNAISLLSKYLRVALGRLIGKVLFGFLAHFVHENAFNLEIDFLIVRGWLALVNFFDGLFHQGPW